MSGKYVAFEGANGVGKSTVLDAIVSELFKIPVDLLVTKEPTETELGNYVRRKQNTLKGKALACLAAADRINHIEQVIEPALSNGRLVISDRCVLSAYLYNKMDGVTFDYTASIYDGIRNPDVIFLFFAPPEVVKKRLNQRAEFVRYEKEDPAKEKAIIDECEAYLNQKGVKIYKLSTETDVGGIAKKVLEIFNKTSIID